MRILLTNNQISTHTGSELYLCEVAEKLKAAGHEPMCFSLTIGPLAERLRLLGIPVSDDFRTLPGPPDVIHGQHFIETTLAAMTYRTVPVISFCHGPEVWQESACQLPNVVHWVVVDLACRRRLVEDEGVDPEKISVLYNHFDEIKFTPRSPLPIKPIRAVIVSNYLHPQHPAVEAITAACFARNIELAMVGKNLNGVVEELGTFLAQFDLVFAKARTCIEALAVGCAVVQVDYFGTGRMVRSGNYDELRPLNFGYRSMTFPLDAIHIGDEIDHYDADDASHVSRRIREEATLAKTVKYLLALYEQALALKVSLHEYDPAIEAADFWRFQSYLSKMPMGGIRKAPGLPLRLPTYPIAAGEVAEKWKNLIAPHLEAAEQMAKMSEQEAKTSEQQAGKKRLADEELRKLTKGKTALKIEQLKNKLITLNETHKQYKNNTGQQIAMLKMKVSKLSEKNARLKARTVIPSKRSWLDRVRRIVGK